MIEKCDRKITWLIIFKLTSGLKYVMMFLRQQIRRDETVIAYAALIDEQEDLLRFTSLAEKYQKEMFRIARSVLHENQLAEDAVQNALYGAAVSIKKVPGEENEARVYLMSCAKHAALRIKAEEAKQSAIPVPEVLEVTPEEDPTFAEVERSDDYERLLTAIRSLDEIYQDALLHFYVYGQSIKEMAQLFGRKPSTVRQQLTRGRRLLAELYRKEESHHG
jgi:RNA polymerase sigma-70 factor (ECF subfamily)